MIHLTIGLGSGKTKLDCSACVEDYTDPESGNKTGYNGATEGQLYTSFGIQLTQLIDIHISHRSVAIKKIEQVYSGAKVNYSGNVTGVGLASKF